MACPSAVVPKGWWPDGLSHQEAPQADGEEEAPQAAEEDADPAQEQEVAVTAGAAGACVACPRLRGTAAPGGRVPPQVGYRPGHFVPVGGPEVGTRWPHWPA